MENNYSEYDTFTEDAIEQRYGLKKYIDLFAGIEESALLSEIDEQVIAATENSRQEMPNFAPKDPIGMVLCDRMYYVSFISKSPAIEAASHLMSLVPEEWKFEDDWIHYKWIQRISLWITHVYYETRAILLLMFDEEMLRESALNAVHNACKYSFDESSFLRFCLNISPPLLSEEEFVECACQLLTASNQMSLQINSCEKPGYYSDELFALLMLL